MINWSSFFNTAKKQGLMLSAAPAGFFLLNSANSIKNSLDFNENPYISEDTAMATIMAISTLKGAIALFKIINPADLRIITEQRLTDVGQNLINNLGEASSVILYTFLGLTINYMTSDSSVSYLASAAILWGVGQFLENHFTVNELQQDSAPRAHSP